MRGTEFAELSSFVAIAERASFARAADHLGISRPTLSQSLRALEDRLGVRLLHRTTRSVALTDAGRLLLERVSPALAELATASAEARSVAGVPAGWVRIVMLPPAAHLIVAPLIARFLAAYPAIKLDLTVSKTPIDLVRSGFDAGIRVGEQIEQDMVLTRVSGPAEFGAFASPAYLARHGMPRAPNDLRNYACIRARLPDGSIFGWEFARRGRRVQVAVDGPLVTDDIDIVRQAVRDGIGIGYGLYDFLGDDIRTGRLVRVLPDWSPRLSGYFLYHPSRRQVGAALRAFIDFLKERANAAPGDAPVSNRRAPRARHRIVR